MKITEIKSCFVGPLISPEQFISEHFFLFLAKGTMNGYDGNKHYTLKPGNSCIVRKNRLARYNKQKDNDKFEKVVFIFDELFLKEFLKKHTLSFQKFNSKDAFISIKKDKLIDHFLISLEPYYTDSGNISSAFSDVKREELLLILLQIHPELADVLFDFGIPGRLDLEQFMQKNYKFNVNVERLAFLTGRSLSAFKRDFKKIFNETPNRWLVKRRLQEARFLIEEKKLRPGDIYLDLGFEDFSHFSFAFKKEFGISAKNL
ncbi:AraC family transcriptional regulator [Chryseobacterium sp. BIGb0232]|uniref:helix-turn-helix domain-containing protein n=1 Tax=Chryseobacterium sp. BIGb0232 TaxID=2940598 RepID=UPI000F47BD3A|nr:AraC family transcriptional regulator [Chryseobacterium sp. BIGb0232]MCS4300594.1 AraC-like DNA-binding protein [Chryseobacterium sp. BIGb0232]ROS20520.1 AraC-like DNA-binding protein [Chryseobacterium nakagawai]